MTDEEVVLAATCLDSRDLPDRDRAADVLAGDRVLAEEISGLDVARALTRRGFADVAAAVFDMQRQRVAADYLQTSAIIEPDGMVVSAVNEPNDYRGPVPATGSRASAGGGCAGCRTRSTRGCSVRRPRREPRLRELGEALPRDAAGRRRHRRRPRVRRRPRGDDQRPRARGRARGARSTASARRGRRRGSCASAARADVAFIGHDGALLSGSGVAVGLQSKGTALIHRADLAAARQSRALRHGAVADARLVPPDRRNAAGYALGRPVAPVPTVLDNYARAKLIVRTTLLHAREAAEVVRGAPPVEVEPVLAPTGRLGFVPGLAVPAPAMRIVALDDHPGVVTSAPALRASRSTSPSGGRSASTRAPASSAARTAPRGQAALALHVLEPPSAPSTRSRSLSGTWSSGTGASASMNVTPFSESSTYSNQ